ncbi:hypothetical protein D9M72_152380 [compost metagenome]
MMWFTVSVGAASGLKLNIIEKRGASVTIQPDVGKPMVPSSDAKSLPSSRVLPASMGTLTYLSAAMAPIGSAGNTVPSGIGATLPCPAAVTLVSSAPPSCARRYSAICAGERVPMYTLAAASSATVPSATSSFSRIVWPCVNEAEAGCSVGSVPGGRLVLSEMPPLISKALWNRPLAIGEVITASRLVAPADSPDSVTLPGSPPKLATLP